MLATLVLMMSGAAAAITVGDCLETTSLVEMVPCFVATMPDRGSGAYAEPTPQELARWERSASEMLGGSCQSGEVDGLPGVRILELDAADGGIDCAMIDTHDRGWGMMVVSAASESSLHIQVPHPLFDRHTEVEGAELYTTLGARSFVMAGSHRYASATTDARTGGPISDPTHATTHPLLAGTRAILESGEDFLVVQLHGMAATTCPTLDVFLSTGAVEGKDPTAALARVARNAHPDWRTGTAVEGAPCRLRASENVVGRLIASDTDEARGGFVSVEQAPDFRQAADWQPVLASLASR